MRRERRKEKQRMQKIQGKEVIVMAELFWSVFNLEMKDLPEIVSFTFDYLGPSLVFFLLWFELLACTLLLGFYIMVYSADYGTISITAINRLGYIRPKNRHHSTGKV